MTKILGYLLLLVSVNALGANPVFWKNHTLVMIYESHCPHCHHQAEVLAPLVGSENIAYQLFSLNNQPLPQFKRFKPTPEGLLQAAYPDGKVTYPALFIVENQSLRLYPLSYGFLDAYALKARIEDLRIKIILFEANTYES